MYPGGCVLLSISKAVRKGMKLWNVSGEGRPWKVELDVRDRDVILTSLGGRELVLFLRGLVRPLSGLLQLMLYLWVFRLNWAGSLFSE